MPLIPTGGNNDPPVSEAPPWWAQTRHPRFPLLQSGKVMDAGLRRHDGEVLTGESNFPPVGISVMPAQAGILGLRCTNLASRGSWTFADPDGVWPSVSLLERLLLRVA